jgi:hypothetical protein
LPRASRLGSEHGAADHGVGALDPAPELERGDLLADQHRMQLGGRAM